jgi:hypothetical protein
MLVTILLAVGVMAAFVLLMSVGLFFNGKELKGTCASRTSMLYGEGEVCGLCGEIPGNCKDDNKKQQRLAPQPLPVIKK